MLCLPGSDSLSPSFLSDARAMCDYVRVGVSCMCERAIQIEEERGRERLEVDRRRRNQHRAVLLSFLIGASIIVCCLCVFQRWEIARDFSTVTDLNHVLTVYFLCS